MKSHIGATPCLGFFLKGVPLILSFLFNMLAIISRFESKELKMLRVGVSGFYDYLAVVLKTMQEFDTTMANS